MANSKKAPKAATKFVGVKIHMSNEADVQLVRDAAWRKRKSISAFIRDAVLAEARRVINRASVA